MNLENQHFSDTLSNSHVAIFLVSFLLAVICFRLLNIGGLKDIGSSPSSSVQDFIESL